ncbi:MAG: hypothetical protein LIP28_00560 [Deltaproteobacteria bacterium]|nr:hypothetical protein [Deltaproteobacteria bacterium]
MDGIQGASGAASRSQGILRDVAGAQVISKTLEKMNTFQTLSGPAVDAGYQFRKDVLHAAGIGTMLNTIA